MFHFHQFTAYYFHGSLFGRHSFFLVLIILLTNLCSFIHFNNARLLQFFLLSICFRCSRLSLLFFCIWPSKSPFSSNCFPVKDKKAQNFKYKFKLPRATKFLLLAFLSSFHDSLLDSICIFWKIFVVPILITPTSAIWWLAHLPLNQHHVISDVYCNSHFSFVLIVLLFQICA